MFKLNILEKIAEGLNIAFNFSGKINSPSTKNKSKVKNSTVGSIQQAHSINNEVKNFVGSEDYISDLEIKILRELYSVLKETGKRPRLDLRVLHGKLDIVDGDYLGTVTDSKFLNIEGNNYVITQEGVRFMDSFVRNNKPEVDIISLAHSGGPDGQELTGLRLINNGSASAIGIKCFLCADGLERINFANIDRLNPNEESHASLGFKYSDTLFFAGPLSNLRIVLEYKNRDSFKFSSGRYLEQKKRADGNYNIHVPPGAYFEV